MKKTQKLGKVRLKAKYKWSDEIAIPHLHSEKEMKTVKPIIAKEFKEEVPRYKELRRH